MHKNFLYDLYWTNFTTPPLLWDKTKKKRKKNPEKYHFHLCVELDMNAIGGEQIMPYNMTKDGRMAAVWRGSDYTQKKMRNAEWSGNVYNRYPVEMVINQFCWRKSVSAPSFKGTRAKIKYTIFFLRILLVSFVDRTRDADTMLCFLSYTQFCSSSLRPFLCEFFTLFIVLKMKEEEKMSHIFFLYQKKEIV